jgi:DNA-binding CsgD family transcriptional regulator
LVVDGDRRAEVAESGETPEILPRSFPGHEILTPRERVVLAQIVNGLSSKEIARLLGISQRTVEFHRANIMAKLGARNSVDLVRKVLFAPVADQLSESRGGN